MSKKKNMDNKKTKNRINTFLKWIGAFILGAVTIYGVILQTPQYKEYLKEQEKPIVELYQNNPGFDHFFPNNIELAYPITNRGNSRAENIELHVIVPGDSKIHFIPNIFELVKIKESDIVGEEDINSLQFKTLIYRCKALDPNEHSILYISINKKKFEKYNSVKEIKISKPFKHKRVVTPNFEYFKFKQGKGVITLKDTLILVDKAIYQENKILEKKNPNKDDVEHTKRVMQNSISELEQALLDLNNFDKIVNNISSEPIKNRINNERSLYELKKYLKLSEDIKLFQVVTDELFKFFLISKRNIDFILKDWKRENLNEFEGIQLINAYKSELITAINILKSEELRLSGKISHNEFNNSVLHIISEKVNNDNDYKDYLIETKTMHNNGYK